MLSLRQRLIIWHAAVFAVGLLAFALVVWFGARRILETEIERWLTTQVEGLDRFLRLELKGTDEAAVIEEAREFSTGLPQGSGVQLRRKAGALLLARPPVRIVFDQDAGSALVERHRARVIRRQTVIEGQSFELLLWRSYEEVEATLWQLAKLLASLTPAFLALSVLGGWWLSRRTLRPVDDLTLAARTVSLSRLSERLPVPESKDELQRLCIAWNEMLTRLEESTNRLKRFTADASHELRTPLAVIRAAAELALRQDREPAAYRHALQGIRDQSVEMGQLVDNLLSLARAEEQQLRSSFVDVDLSEVVRTVALNSRPAAEAKGLQLSTSLPESPAIIRGDATSLRQLLNLLVDNALKFTDSPGRVGIRIEARSGQCVVLEVADTGAGILPEDLPRIFDRFYQADPSRSVTGSGLGLSLARWIALTHEAAIEVTSSPGQGSAFRVVFRMPTASWSE